ncbi:MAG TPA: hypothetical protein DEP72_02305 [Clostridiales bacterium]|nr:MAG: hypothetical protein A2Y18_00495 [Clostridiales bacterium GWD2_32_19]HCC06988.1 hypothetical protein [Clostridiales bacterium]
MIKRRLVIAFICLFCIGSLFCNSAYAATTLAKAKIVGLYGTVQIKKGGGEKTFSAFKGMYLTQGDMITTGINSWVEVSVESDSDIKVGENAKVFVSQLNKIGDKKNSQFSIWSGGIWANVKQKLNTGSKFEIKTPTAIMGVRGTKLYVTCKDGKSKFSILSGRAVVRPNEVTVLNENGQSTQIDDANEVIVEKNNEVTIENEMPVFIQENARPIDTNDMDTFLLDTIKKVIEEEALLTLELKTPEQLEVMEKEQIDIIDTTKAEELIQAKAQEREDEIAEMVTRQQALEENIEATKAAIIENVTYQSSTSTSTSSGGSTSVDSIAPTCTITADVADINNATNITYTFTFSESVNGFNVEDITVTKGTKGIFGGSGNSYTLIVSYVEDGEQMVNIAGSVCTDSAGNNNASASKTVIMDKTAPNVTIGAPSATTTNVGTITYAVTYTEDSIVNLTTEKITLHKTGTADAMVTVTDGTTSTPIVTISNITGSGMVGIMIADTVTDIAGNTAAVEVQSTQFTVDNTEPTAAITYSLTGPFEQGNIVTITATFSEPIKDSTVPQISISGANTLAPANMVKSSTTVYTYSFTVLSGNGTATIALATAQDSVGNAVASVPTSGGSFYVQNIEFSFDGINANKLMGTNTIMEYSLDAGASWIQCTNNTDLTSALASGSINSINDINVRVKENLPSPAGAIKTIDILSGPVAPTYGINYAYEKTTQVVATTDEYSEFITMSSPISGVGAVVNLTPETNLYFRVKATGLTLPGEVQTLTVVNRPATPTATYTLEVGTGICYLTNVTTAMEYSTNVVTAWNEGTGTTIVILAESLSYIKVRVKATGTIFASNIQEITILAAPVVFNGVHNEPKLLAGMTPVTFGIEDFANATIQERADKTWYSYSTDLDQTESERLINEKWANVKLVDGSMFVWIPRYTYKITENGLSSKIEIKYSNGITDDTVEGTYKVHPAFDFGGTPLTGIWVAKFEASQIEIESGKVQVKPGVSSWIYNSVSDIYDLCRAMQTTNSGTYGISSDSNIIDIHMMKNSEWGAVAYLTEAIRDGVEVNKNSSSVFNTGGSGIIAYVYTTDAGQSTTGNAYGIYDMNGGAKEYVASYIGTGNINGARLIDELDVKYKDVPIGTSTSDSQTNYVDIVESQTYGWGLHEVMTGGTGYSTFRGYEDTQEFPNNAVPFFIRGGDYNSVSGGSGIFAVQGYSGAADIITFRPVIIGLN